MKKIIIGLINIALVLTVIGQIFMYNADQMPGDQFFSCMVGWFTIWAVINFADTDDTVSDAVSDKE